MIQRASIRLASPAHEMAQEEIQKQVAYLSKEIGNPRFVQGGVVLEFDAPAELVGELTKQAEKLAARVQRGLRSLERKIIYRSPTADQPIFRGDGRCVGVHQLGAGQVALEGLPLRLFRYFDRAFEAFGAPWDAQPVQTPALIPSHVLAKCDYFRSFPHSVTFACHLTEAANRIADFRARHQNRDDLDDRVLSDMETPDACLSPAMCYHVYHMNENRVLPEAGAAYGLCGKCFRYESSNFSGLRRLWDFTLREVVLLGGRDYVLAGRDRSLEMMSRFLDEHQLAGEIRTASDPFFTAPDAVAKTYFQLSSETKYEISLMLPDGERLAVGSHNYHTDFFGRAFNVSLEAGGPMYSVCVGFGLERWVYAFLVQHGENPSNWPAAVRRSPEFGDGNR